MGDWKTLLAAPRFRGLWLAMLGSSLGSWSVLAALPILVAERYGAGSALVLSLSWRILPKLILAPVSGALLRRFGAPRITVLALAAEAALTAALPWCRNFAVLQVVIASIGALDVFVLPGITSLRGAVTPGGFELAGNSLCSMADRISKTAGPAIGGVALFVGFAPAFLGFAVVIGLAALPLARLHRPQNEAVPHGWNLVGLPAEFWRMLCADRMLAGLLVCAVTYMVLVGGLRPFLFWANREWFAADDVVFTWLLAAHGAGAVLGALAAGTFGRKLQRIASAYTLTLVSSFLEGAGYLLLVLCPLGAAGTWAAIMILAITGVPEVFATAAWFTVLQQRLSPERQGLFLAFTAPMWDCAYVVGVLSAGLHAGGLLTLSPWWVVLSLTATLPILPLLAAEARRRPAPAEIV